MYPISSSLTSQTRDYFPFREAAEQKGFTLGGNWDYDHGSFDCALDTVNKVWLRLPFQVTRGSLDSEMSDVDVRILLGEPYVLKHVYNEGLDKEAHPRAMGAMIDQFSDPVDADADIEPNWIEEAKRKIREIESF
ncbi:YugN family protein [Cohnella candidum]|uniref:YugN-like family protein n=1 Tax=Cohnella candidum TaxID=2674991 RepID=A0A3G3JZ84_9BACL|nr:YugN family protein [Cohnella candidum]AYQ73568.1 hypothetical protein EAV92_13855 [Cohnella candidum]